MRRGTGSECCDLQQLCHGSGLASRRAHWILHGLWGRATQGTRECRTRGDAEGSEARRFEAQDRWLAAVLPPVPSGRALGLHAFVADPIVPTVTHLHARIAKLIAHFPDLDPAALAARWAEHPCAPEALDIAGIAPRHDDTHGPPGSLPQARASPSRMPEAAG